MAFSAVTVFNRHNFEYFEFCVDILNEYSFTRNTSVFCFFFFCEFTAFRFLFRRFAVRMNFSDSLIPAVHLLFYALKNATADCVFIYLEIMRFSAILRNAYDFFCTFVYNYLCFYGVLFLLAGIISFLFFLGRSIGLSVTSTRITSILSSSSNTFLPGNLNFSSLTSVSSTHFIVS